MDEYKVKFKAQVKGLFGPTVESVEVYRAESAQEAIEKCKADYRRQVFPYEDDVDFSILDVEKL